jgi:hypothetical protein
MPRIPERKDSFLNGRNKTKAESTIKNEAERSNRPESQEKYD